MMNIDYTCLNTDKSIHIYIHTYLLVHSTTGVYYIYVYIYKTNDGMEQCVYMCVYVNTYMCIHTCIYNQYMYIIHMCVYTYIYAL